MPNFPEELEVITPARFTFRAARVPFLVIGGLTAAILFTDGWVQAFFVGVLAMIAFVCATLAELLGRISLYQKELEDKQAILKEWDV